MKIEQDCYIDMDNYDRKMVVDWLEDQDIKGSGLRIHGKNDTALFIYLMAKDSFFSKINDLRTAGK